MKYAHTKCTHTEDLHAEDLHAEDLHTKHTRSGHAEDFRGRRRRWVGSNNGIFAAFELSKMHTVAEESKTIDWINPKRKRVCFPFWTISTHPPTCASNSQLYPESPAVELS